MRRLKPRSGRGGKEMARRSHRRRCMPQPQSRTSSSAAEAPPQTQCKQTYRTEHRVSLFATTSKNLELAILHATCISSNTVSPTKTQALYTILPPQPPPEQRPDWQAVGRSQTSATCRKKLRGSRGAPAFLREQRTNDETLPLCWVRQWREGRNSGNGGGRRTKTSYRALQDSFARQLCEELTRAFAPEREYKVICLTEHNKGDRKSGVQEHIKGSLRTRSIP
jgi:hypothetical protein